MLKKGSIYLTELLFTDQKKSKIRPVVVLHHDVVYDDVIVMAISSVISRRPCRNTILISASDNTFKETGLKKESVILTNRIVTLNRKRLFHWLGRFSNQYLEEIDRNIVNIFQIGITNQTNQTNSTTFIPYGRQTIDDDDVYSVVKTLRSAWLTQGPKVAEFESALCNETDADFAVCLNSGTSALYIACLAAGVGANDEVVTSPITFVASANCAVYCGAKPVFADICRDTYNISPEEIEKKITSHTKAIIPVHFAGQSCDMDAIRQIVSAAEKKYGHKIYVIEDACHALGSLYKNKKVGSCAFSDMTVMSFHPVKHITTGEGGAVLTNDEGLLKKLRLSRSHGITSDPKQFVFSEEVSTPSAPSSKLQAPSSKLQAPSSMPQAPSSLPPAPCSPPWYYEQIALGYNYRITDIQCALGLSQLKKLARFRKRRREIVNQYNAVFKDLEFIQIPFENSSCDSNFHLYVLLFDFEKIDIERAQFMLELRQKDIQTQVHYIPVHLQPFYRKHFGTNIGDCPNAGQYYKNCLSIPLFPTLKDSEIEYIVKTVKSFFQ